MIADILAFIRLNWRWFAAGGAALAVILAVVGFGAHERHVGAAGEQSAELERLAKAQKRVAQRETAAQGVTDTAKAKIAAQRVEIQYRTRTLIEKVPTYVTPQADADCTVPRGFVVLHDAAASGSPASLPGAAGGPLDAPSGVPLSAVAETVVANYGVAYDWRAEALGWRGWYTAQKAEWDRK